MIQCLLIVIRNYKIEKNTLETEVLAELTRLCSILNASIRAQKSFRLFLMNQKEQKVPITWVYHEHRGLMYVKIVKTDKTSKNA